MAELSTPSAKDVEAWQLYNKAAQSADPDEVVTLVEQARQLFAQEPASQGGLAAVAFSLGLMAMQRQGPQAAVSFFQQTADYFRTQPPSPPGATCLTQLGLAQRQLGDSAAALVAFQQALSIFRQLNDPLGILDRLLDVAQESMGLDRPGPAEEALNEAIQIAESRTDADRLIRALQTRAYVRLMQLSDLSGSRNDWMRLTEMGTPTNRADAWLQVSGIDLVQHRVEDGISAVQKALDQYKQTNSQMDIGLCLMRLADLESSAKPDRARAVYEEAIDVFVAQGLSQLEVQARSNLAALQQLQGHLEDAIAKYGLALEKAEQLNLHLEAATCCRALSVIHQAINHPTESAEYSRRAAQHWAQIPDQSGAAQASIARAQAMASNGHCPDALASLDALLTSCEARPDKTITVLVNSAIAQIALGCEDLARAISHASAAQQLYDSLQMLESSVTSRLAIADVYGAAAVASQRNALSVALDHNLPDQARDSRVALAKSLFDAGDWSEARTQLQSALASGVPANPFLESRIHVGLSLAAERLDDDDQAFAELKLAANVIDAFRLDFAMPDLAAAHVGSLTNVYNRLIRGALIAGERTTAFDYVEQSRSRAMLRLAGFAPLPTPPSLSPETASQERQSLRDAEVALRQLMSKAEDSQALSELRAAYAKLDSVWTSMGPSDYVALRRGDTVSFVDTRAGLADESKRVVLVEFFCREKTTMVFGIRPEFDEPDVVSVPLDQTEFGQFVKANFGSHDPVMLLVKPEMAAAWQAYNFLISPIARWADPGDLVYLVPHRLLHYVPLHSLTIEGKPLIDRNPVVYSPSASVLQYCRAKRGSNSGGQTAAVFGDSRGDLPNSRDEAQQVAKWFGAKPLLGPEVTFASVQQSVQAVDIVHFAGHGYFDALSPLDSGLLLSGNETLTARQIFGLPFRSRLVTLSGCQTGVSDVQPGDELMGLTRAFLSAGVPSLLVSLWRVADASTAYLMTRFYTLLQESPTRSKAAALRQAMLETREQPGWDSFYHWAPFILVGDWQ